MLVLPREKSARDRAEHATYQRAPRSDHRARLGATGCSTCGCRCCAARSRSCTTRRSTSSCGCSTAQDATERGACKTADRAAELLVAGLGLRCAHRIACVALCLFLRGSAEPLRSRVLLVLTEANERRRATTATVVREVGANPKSSHA